jgi:crotonobetainyl-CoA:carnitine CoA-transferase CaiB-like acyl-CoA transferase
MIFVGMGAEKLQGKTKAPLSEIRVLELGSMIAGPVVGTLMADFGAEVIKLEQPVSGDPIRHSGPFADGESLYWAVEGRNKKSMTLDLHIEEGQELLKELVRHADVLVENFRPGTMEKWGVGYKDLSAINPRLIMLSVSGYGQTGPYATQAAYDRVALAFSGFLNISGYPDRPPVRPGVAVADYQSALFGAFSVMMALYMRDATGGTGLHIDVSLYESVFRFTDVMTTAYDKLGIRRERNGNAHFAASPGDHYETDDGRHIALTVASDRVFQRLCVAMGKPELVEDAKYKTHTLRVENYTEINGIVAKWIRGSTVDAIGKALTAEGVPYSLIYNVADILADPHYAARGSIATVKHPRLGDLKMPAVLPLMSGVERSEIRPAPDLGVDTEHVLRDILGMSPEAIAKLREGKVL